MNLNPLIEKYLQDKNETRLEILLETAGKKSTKKNIEMVKLLIADEDYTSLFKFLGTTKEEKQAKKELDDFNIEEFEHNQDDLLNKVKASFGEPTEFNSLGNRILNGTVTKWTMTSAIHPDVLLRKFANQAQREYVEIEYFPMFGGKLPQYQCGIAGVVKLDRWIKH